jgi:predicted permease
MRTLKTVRLRLRSLLRGSRVEQELDEELRDHLEREIERRVASGQPADDARAAARRAFGNVPLVQEQVRDTRGLGWLEDLQRDVVYALRSIRRTPGFAAVAVLSLAVSIGANTTIFSLVNALLLRQLPVESPHELMEVGRETPFGAGSFPHAVYERMRDQHTTFSGVLTVSSPVIRAEDDGSDRPPRGRYVSGNFFDLLGVQPRLGRLLTPGDDRRDSTSVVIGYGLWQRKFGGDQGVIGQTLAIASPLPLRAAARFTIVGVLPPEFEGLTVGLSDDFFIPIASEPRLSPRSLTENQYAGWLKIVGRLKPGVSRDAAEAEAAVIYARFIADAAARADEAETRRRRGERVTVEPAGAGLSGPRREYGRPVLLLMGAVGLVLLVACANLVNLLLARGLARRGEIGVRLAIGAARGRLIRQLLAESAVLGLFGGALGLAIAMWGTPGIATLMANEDPAIAYDVAPDAMVLLFTAALSLGCALVAGLIPALRVSRNRVPSLRDDAGAQSQGGAATLWSRGLIAVQVALSLLLLAGALLLIETIRNFRSSDAGFDRRGIVTMRLDPGRAGYTGDRREAYLREVLSRARATAGVRHAAISLGMPVISGGVNSSFVADGQPLDPDALVNINDVTEGYFAATGTRLLRGRDFGPQDTAASAPVAIVNEAAARRHFGDRDPIGHRVRIGIRGVVDIVGVVETTPYESLRDVNSPIAYVHAFQSLNPGALNLTMKTDGDPLAVAETVRRALQDVAAIPVGQPITLAAQIDRTIVKERLIARVLGAFAFVALVLAAVGLYGVLAYAVTRRRSEIGVRLALGATRGRVLRPVLAESARLVALGVAVGIPAALLLTRVLSNVLYGVTPTDGTVLGGVVLLLCAVAIAAAAVPAWRASRVDPLIALRSE